MAGVATHESGAGSSIGIEQQCQSGEALAEWRSSEQVENGVTSTSPPYWDSDDNDDGGLKPSELYGTHTWTVENFSQINKREHSSKTFQIGGYKWYILIYPQGCDVRNHLSLFLCVSGYDKLLPGWSHFAQFTISVVNKDPKKSKYSDTLHRFWKKEHDWGWKKFMELSKMLDGFINDDTLIIKAQVQVIRERSERPFRCLDCHYRRELVRVYLTNVEQLCGRFIEEQRTKLGKLIEDKARWSSFCCFWLGMDQSSRRRMSREKTESILKVVVKHFFIEKEVTSTLVMDALYTGLKALGRQNKEKKSKGKYMEAEEIPIPIVRIEKDTFVLVDDVLLMLERAAVEPLPPKDEKGPQNRTEDGGAGEEFNKDSIERDERQLTELGHRTIEIFVLAQIFSKIDVSYQEAVALKKQEELIREEAAWLAESEQKAKRGADNEKKSKKKQGKQKRNNHKGKDKGRVDKSSNILQDKIEQDSPTVERKDVLVADAEMVHEKTDAVEDVSDVSDSIDCFPEIPPPDSEDTDTSEIQSPTKDETNEQISGVQNGLEVRSPSAIDDSSSTCSSDSVPSVVLSVPHKSNSHYHKNPKSPSRVKNHQSKLTSETDVWVNGDVSQPSEAVANGRHLNGASQSSKNGGSVSQAAVRPLQARVVNGTERHVGKKEEETSIISCNSMVKNVEVSKNRTIRVTSPPTSPSRSIPFPKLKSNSYSASDPIIIKKSSSDSHRQAYSSNSAINGATLNPEPQKVATPKPAEKPSRHHQLPIISEKAPAQQAPVVSRPPSAPLAPGPKPSVSMIQTAPILARSASAAGRLGPEPPTPTATPSYIPQSYRNAIIGGPSSPAYSQNLPASSGVNSSYSYSQPLPVFVSAPPFSPHGSDTIDSKPNHSFGMANHHDMLQNGLIWSERAHERDLSSLVNDMQRFNLYNPTVSNASRAYLRPEFPAGTSGHQSQAVADEFPYLDIINELLDDECGMGRVDGVNSAHQSFSNGSHHLNQQFSLPGVSGLSMSMCRFDRTQSYQDDIYQYGYGPHESTYDTVRDMITRASPQPYVNGPVDGFRPNQWQMAGIDLPYSSLRNDGYTYHMAEYPNHSLGINGYTLFRPSNGL